MLKLVSGWDLVSNVSLRNGAYSLGWNAFILVFGISFTDIFYVLCGVCQTVGQDPTLAT